jgi:hypothetical protein
MKKWGQGFHCYWEAIIAGNFEQNVRRKNFGDNIRRFIDCNLDIYEYYGEFACSHFFVVKL